MANTYTWDITQLQCYPFYGGQTNVVVAIHWILTGTDGVNTVTRQGVAGVAFNSDGEFTAYENLTKDEIIAWMQSSLGEEGVQEAKNGVNSDLAQLASRPVFTAVPWS
jgi:hypothetical protein